MRTLVTGGAGYIGSHMVQTLLDVGHTVLVVDDLSSGYEDAIPAGARFVRANVGDAGAMRDVLEGERIDAVLHFAAKIRVEESVQNPRLYWHANLGVTLSLLDAVLDAGIEAFVQSSTAAVYGVPDAVPIDEEQPKRPVNAYGESKLAVERVLETYEQAHGLRWAALRYFNAAGAHPEAGLGERHDPETHLIPIVLEVAEGRRSHVSLFGTSWPTPDGTCVRDYVHVRDLCEAHLAALDRLREGKRIGPVNVGTGRGHSVREVVEAARAVTGRDIPVAEAPPRPGDPPVLVAKVERAKALLGWQASRTELRDVVADAWAYKTGAPPG